MGELLHDIRGRLQPALAARVTAMPVVPAGARHATLNINSITGGQSGHDVQSPCVADTCRAIFDRRFLPEESFDRVQGENRRRAGRVAAASPRGTLQHARPDGGASRAHPRRVAAGGVAATRGRRRGGARGSHRGLAGDVRPQARDAHRRKSRIVSPTARGAWSSRTSLTSGATSRSWCAPPRSSPSRSSTCSQPRARRTPRADPALAHARRESPADRRCGGATLAADGWGAPMRFPAPKGPVAVNRGRYSPESSTPRAGRAYPARSESHRFSPCGDFSLTA
jgi:hypothetical protein